MLSLLRTGTIPPDEIRDTTHLISGILDNADKIISEEDSGSRDECEGEEEEVEAESEAEQPISTTEDAEPVLQPIRSMVRLLESTMRDTILMIQRGDLPRALIADLQDVFKRFLQGSNDFQYWSECTREAAQLGAAFARCRATAVPRYARHARSLRCDKAHRRWKRTRRR